MASLECWERERTTTSAWAFVVRLHGTGCSLRETKAILALLGVNGRIKRFFNGFIGYLTSFSTGRRGSQWTKPLSKSTASGLGCTLQEISKLLLDVKVFDRHGTDSAAAFLSGLAEKHDFPDAVFLVDGYGYRTSLFRIGLSGRLNYTERNLIEKWFHTLKQLIDPSKRREWAVGRVSSGSLSSMCITISINDTSIA